jgi:hypothetical protein
MHWYILRTYCMYAYAYMTVPVVSKVLQSTRAKNEVLVWRMRVCIHVLYTRGTSLLLVVCDRFVITMRGL